MIKGRWEEVALGIVVIAVLAIYLPKIWPSQEQQSTTLSSSGGDYLTSTNDVSVYDKLTESDQIKVRRAVQYFCEINWHEDSCLHHAITCGKKCLTYLKPAAQKQVREAYFRRKKQAGI